MSLPEEIERKIGMSERMRRNAQRRADEGRPEIDTSVVYLTPAELASEVGVSKSTVIYHIQNGILHSLIFGSRHFFHPDEVERYKALFRAGLIKPRGAKEGESK